MRDFHTETQNDVPKTFTVISGGKSQTPGESHTHNAIDHNGNAATIECKGGLLIRFDDSPTYNKLKGVGVVNADIFPPELLLVLIKLAMDSKR